MTKAALKAEPPTASLLTLDAAHLEILGIFPKLVVRKTSSHLISSLKVGVPQGHP